ncbi:hypothetical protein E4U13_005785 [Claviceps humidiphila]|uniref:non-specific serine/threonine protein kinase n=1 Tax=Claviceps humidiphila TaxID=1294629 RepID=A0A9P7PX83_9HYPO|nr:hypothetical protein E4U13_005785 [Claviceps humidiphila]
MPCDWERLVLYSSGRKPACAIHEPIEEAHWSERLEYFHSTRPGQILDDRFKTIAKLGFGSGSTVWLAKNLKLRWRKSKLPRYVVIKITASDVDDEADEKGWLRIVANANPSHEGLKHIQVPLDTFDLQGISGTHPCLVFEPMRGNLCQFQERLPRRRFPLPMFKDYIRSLLQALDYLHTECRLIHTDLKEDNILITMEHESVLKDLIDNYKTNSQPTYTRKEDGHVTYLSHDKMGDIRVGHCLLRLADFNTCFTLPPGNRHHQGRIQSDQYRAPEVLVGFPWSYKVDIWNLGVMMFNLLEYINLFDPVGEDGKYDAHVHLAQIISYLGKAPPLMVKRERESREILPGVPMMNEKGEDCETMNKYWGGPFFDDDGFMIRKELIQEERCLVSLVTELQGKDKAQFANFATGMIRWLPENRKTAKELLQHPFLAKED